MPDPITDPTPDPTPPAVVTPPAPPAPEPVDQPLGEAGQRALAREREAAAEARREAATMKAELEALRASQMSDHEKALAAAKAEGVAEVSAKFAQRVLLSEVRAAAASKLADPTDAVRLLDLDKFKVADDGTVDVAAITSAIDELVTSKPYLAAGKPPASRTATDTGQGTRSRPTTPVDPETMPMAEYIAARKAGTIQ